MIKEAIVLDKFEVKYTETIDLVSFTANIEVQVNGIEDVDVTFKYEASTSIANKNVVIDFKFLNGKEFYPLTDGLIEMIFGDRSAKALEIEVEKPII